MQTRTGNPAIRNGLIFGIIIAVLGVGNTALSYATRDTTAAGLGLVGILAFIIDLALFFVAGMMTARATGTVGSGAVSGLVAGLIGGLIGGIVAVIFLLTNPLPISSINSAGSGLSESDLRNIVIVGGIIGLVLGLLLDAGLGAGLGALGALVGRGQYQSAHPAAAYQESMYQGMPQPGYPAQPGAYPPPPPAPGYPPQPGQPGQQWPQYPPSQPPQQ